MSRALTYYLALNSPWAFLGGAPLAALAAAKDATVEVRPLDLMRLYQVTGGIPLPKRAPARQAYRLRELARWRDRLGIPLVLEPAVFPFDERRAAACVLAVQAKGGDALGLAIAFGHALWVEDRDLNDRDAVAAVLTTQGLDASAVLAEVEGDTDRWEAVRQGYTDAAVADGVFGVPTYVVDGEPFWGQDRLDFVEAALG